MVRRVQQLNRRHAVIALLGAFAMLRVLAEPGHPTVLPDSASYDHLNFLGHAMRLWTVPLVYTLLHGENLRASFQTVLGIGCWSLLAVNAARSVRSPGIASVLFALVLLLGLVPQVTLWDDAIMSESISTSLFVLLTALVIRPRRDWTWIGAVLAVLTLWAFSRQDNATVLVMLSPALIWFAARRLPGRKAAATALLLLVLAGWSGYAALIAPGNSLIRNFNAAELAVDRWDHQPGAMRYMGRHGLPVALVRHAAVHPYTGAVWLSEQPRFASWVDSSFTSAYSGLLVSQLPGTITSSLASLPGAAAQLPAYAPYRSLVPLSWLWGTGTALWLIVATLLTAVALSRRMPIPWAPLSLMTTSVLFCLLVVNLSSREGHRLLLPAGLALHLAIVIGGLQAVDWLLEAVRARHRHAVLSDVAFPDKP
jgi:hypothetical protein